MFVYAVISHVLRKANRRVDEVTDAPAKLSASMICVNLTHLPFLRTLVLNTAEHNFTTLIYNLENIDKEKINTM